MKKSLMFVVLCLMFCCSPQEEQVPFVVIDSSKVYLNPEPDTVFLQNFVSDSLLSEITCPKCNFTKKEKMPTDICLLKYTCTSCKTELFPKEEDCCVFCSYGTEKCPSMQ